MCTSYYVLWKETFPEFKVSTSCIPGNRSHTQLCSLALFLHNKFETTCLKSCLMESIYYILKEIKNCWVFSALWSYSSNFAYNTLIPVAVTCYVSSCETRTNRNAFKSKTDECIRKQVPLNSGKGDEQHLEINHLVLRVTRPLSHLRSNFVICTESILCLLDLLNCYHSRT